MRGIETQRLENLEIMFGVQPRLPNARAAQRAANTYVHLHHSGTKMVGQVELYRPLEVAKAAISLLDSYRKRNDLGMVVGGREAMARSVSGEPILNGVAVWFYIKGGGQNGSRG